MSTKSHGGFVLAATLIGAPLRSGAQETLIPCQTPLGGVVASCTATVFLHQAAAPQSSFSVAAGAAVTATSGDGIQGNNTRNWSLTNRGSVIAPANTVSLNSATANGARFENFGTVSGGNNSGNRAVNMANGGTVINHDGASITSTRDAVYMNVAGSTVGNDGFIQGASTGNNNTTVYFQASGTFSQSATGVIAGVHGVLFNAGTFTATNAGSIDVGQNGVWARNGASGTVNNAGGTIATTGAVTDKAAVLAQSGASVILSGGAIRASGKDARGLYASGSPGVQSTIDATDVIVNANGQGAFGVRTNAPAQINLNDVTIATQGVDATAVNARHNGTVTFKRGTVTTTGEKADGLTAVGGSPGTAGGVIVAENVEIKTSGRQAYGARAVGLSPPTNPQITMTGGSISTSGDVAVGLVAVTHSTLTANDVVVTTTGSGSAGATAQDTSRLIINGGSVTTTGPGAIGLLSSGTATQVADPTALPDEPPALSVISGAEDAPQPGASPGSSVTATGVTVTTFGAASRGVLVRGGNFLTLTDSVVVTHGADGHALRSTAFDPGASTATVVNSTLTSDLGMGIDVNGTTLNATLTASTVTGAAGMLHVAAGGVLNLTVDSSTLNGAALTDAGSTASLLLKNGTTWTVLGDSTVTSLDLDRAVVQYGGAFGVAGAIELGAGGGAFDTQGFDATLSEALSGVGALSKRGAGTLVLAADNGYTGGTTIGAGTLRIGDGATAGAILGDVINNGALVFDRSDDVAFAGAIGGSGAVVQAGAGTLTLAGANSYAGGTQINGGTLLVGSDAALGAAAGELAFDGGTLRLTGPFASARAVVLQAGGGTIDNGGYAAVFSGAVSGEGGLTATGSAGTLILTGDSVYTGTTTINAGRLLVNGIIASPVNVGVNGTLGGTGTVGSVQNAGIVSPGASIGIFRIQGDYLQQATGTLLIELDDQNNADRLQIAGAALLAGRVEYVPAAGSTFDSDLLEDVIVARDGVSGEFVTSVQGYAGVVFETVYSSTGVQVVIDSVPIVDNLVEPGDEDLVSCVASLDAQRGAVSGTSAAPVLGALVQTPLEDLPGTVHGICPRDPSALPAAIDTEVNARFGLLTHRIAEVRAANATAAGGLFDSYRLRDGVSLWLRGTYVDGEQDARDLLRAGYDSGSRGFALGVDVALGDSGVLGAYLARDYLDVNYRAPVFVGGQSGQAEDRGWTLGAYGSYWSPARWFVQGALEYGWHDLESSRALMVGPLRANAEGERDGKAFAATAGAGYNFERPGRWLIQPQASVSYHRFADDGYTESGADALDLTYSDLDADTLRGEAGVTVRKALADKDDTGEITVLYVYANYVYDKPLDDRDLTVQFAIAAPFQMLGDEDARDGVRYGLGFENTWRSNMSLQVLLDAQRYGEIETRAASLQFTKRF